MLVFNEGRKLEKPEKNPRSKVRNNSKFNPHDTMSTGIEPRAHGLSQLESKNNNLDHLIKSDNYVTLIYGDRYI